MTKQRHPSFQAYMDEFNQQMQINCGINAIARMQEEVAICYQRGLTMDECLNHVDMQCGLSEMYLKPEA